MNPAQIAQHYCVPLLLLAMTGGMAGPIAAQVVPDNTLPTQVSGDCAGGGGTCTITNGAVRGSNLFHSFRQFSLPNGDVADFQIAPATQNVIVRVTGVGVPFSSTINGTIQTSSAANFFLLNPNGIVLGPGASLIIGGSFLATTAERLQFQDGTVFNTRDATPLLTIAVPTGLQMGQTPGGIQAETQLVAGVNSLFTDLALVGGDVTLTSTFLVASGHRVDIGGLAAQGTVGLNTSGPDLDPALRLNFADAGPRGNVTLRNGSVIDVSAAGGGAIALTGQNITLNGSLLLAGINGDAGNVTAGDITLNATQQVTLGGTSSVIPNSAIINAVLPNSVGNSGNIRISAGALAMNDGAQLLVNTTSQGNAGNVLIQARDRVTLNNVASIQSNVTLTGVGRGGNVDIVAPTIALQDAQIQSLTAGQGNAGNVKLNADHVTLIGGVASGFASVVTSVLPTGTGRGGDIQITAGTLELLDGGALQAASAGRGNSGDIVVDVRDRVFFNQSQAISLLTNTGVGNAGEIRIAANTIELRGAASTLQSSTSGLGNAGNIGLTGRDRVTVDGSQILSAVDRNAIGQGGDIQIATQVLEVLQGQLNASTLGQGNAGNIVLVAGDRVVLNHADIASAVGDTALGQGGSLQIRTPTLTVNNQSVLNTSSFGAGGAGAILITANQALTLDRSAIASRALAGSTGRSNDIVITSDRIALTQGASILANTNTAQPAGNIQINTNRLSIAGVDPQSGQPSGLYSQTGGTGSGGNIVVNTNAVGLIDQGTIDVSAIAAGDSGAITINANTVDLLRGGQLSASTDAAGKAGTITVNARSQLTIIGAESGLERNRADPNLDSRIVVRSLANGEAGNIVITTPQLRLERGALNAQSATADGGNIILNVQDLVLMRQGSLITATAGTAQQGGKGGNVIINTPSGFLITALNENNDITANAFSGAGGKVTINAQGIYGFTLRSRAELARLLGTNDPVQLDPRRLPTNDITAISQGSPELGGTVTLNTPNIDPSRGLVSLPETLADASNRLAQRCPQRGRIQPTSAFYITGRGGLPQRPGNLSLSAYPTVTVRAVVDGMEEKRGDAGSVTAAASPAIAQANAISHDTQGNLWLVAAQTADQPAIPWWPTLGCQNGSRN